MLRPRRVQRGNDRLTVIAYDIRGVVVVLASCRQQIKDHLLRLFAGGAPDQGKALQRIHASASLLPAYRAGKGEKKRAPAFRGSKGVSPELSDSHRHKRTGGPTAPLQRDYVGPST